MAEIDGGGLHFTATLDNEQLNAAMDESVRRVQGLSDATVVGGQKMDAAFDNTADGIRNAIGVIGAACEMHEAELSKLEAKYQILGQQMGMALNSGNDDEYNRLKGVQQGIQGEITARKQLLKEARDYSDELENQAKKQEENKQKTEANANANVSMRTRIKEVREEMMLLVDQGIDEQSEAYQRLKNELGRLIDIQGDVAQQGKILANDEQKYQGIIQGLSGLAGGFSAVTGTVSLFAGENEDLQKVMTKVQSVMAITIGMQQVAQTLNKDSAFQLVTLNGLKEWWAGVVAKATIAETAETIATGTNTVVKKANSAANVENAVTETADTAAKGGNVVVTKTATLANIGLAGAFRLVGVAIKSIPVVGWIIAGITALAAGIYALTSKAREAKKAQEEFSKAMIEGCYKPIGTIEMLSTKYAQLGDDMAAKQKFIEQNKKAFDELGVSINNVTDAENLLIANKNRFILSQIAKAKAIVYGENANSDIKELIEKEAEYNALPNTSTVTIQTSSFGNSSYTTGKNPYKEFLGKEIKAINEKIKRNFENAFIEEKNSSFNLKKGKIKEADSFDDGTVGAIEQEISRRQDSLKRLKYNSKKWKDTFKEIETLKKQIGNQESRKKDGVSSKSTSRTSNKDPFLEKLEKRKNEYATFMKWINSDDESIRKAAPAEFENILKDGNSYLDYLKKMKDNTILTKEQIHYINNEIVGETNQSMLDTFKESLAQQLDNSKTVIGQLEIIKQKREDIKDDDPLKTQKESIVNEFDNDYLKKSNDELKSLLDAYQDYEEQRTEINKKYDYERKRIELSGISQDLISKKLKVLEEARKESIQSVNDAEIEETKKSTDLFVRIFADASTKSVNEIRRIIAETENLYAYLQGQENSIKPIGITDEQLSALKKNPEELRALQEAIQNLKAEVSGKSPFIKFTDDISSAINKIKKGGIENIGDGIVDIGSASQKIMPKVEKFGQDLGAIFGGDMADDINVITDLLGATADVGMGVGKIMSGDVVGGITDVVSGLSKVFTMASEAEKRHQEALKAIANEKIAYQREYNFLIIQQNELLKNAETIFGVDAYAKAVGYIQQMELSVAALNAELAGTDAQVAKFSSIKLFGGFTRELNSAQNKLKKSYAGLADIEIKTGHKKTGLFGWGNGKDIYSSILDVYPKLIKANGEFDSVLAEVIMKTRTMSDSDKAAFQGIIDLSKMASEALAGVKDYLTGIFGELGNTISNLLVDAFRNGTDASEKFKESVTNMLENLAEQMIYNVTLAPLMGKAQEQMLSIMKNSGLSSEQKFNSYVGILDNLMNNAIGEQNNFNDLLSKYKELAREKGFNLFEKDENEKDNTSLTGAVKGVSEETASLIGGQMNAIRINQMEATLMLRQQLFHLANIDHNTGAIDENTRYNRYIKDIYEKMNSCDSLRSKGSLY